MDVSHKEQRTTEQPAAGVDDVVVVVDVVGDVAGTQTDETQTAICLLVCLFVYSLCIEPLRQTSVMILHSGEAIQVARCVLTICQDSRNT